MDIDMRGSTQWKVWLQIKAPGYLEWVLVAEGSETKCKETFAAFKEQGSTVRLAEIETRYHDSVGVKKVKPDSKFKEWYDQYPRKDAPRSAERAYVAALRRDTTHDKLMSALLAFKREMADTEKTFIPMPATYLNGGRYQTEDSDPDENLDERRLQSFRANGVWLPSWGQKPRSSTSP